LHAFYRYCKIFIVIVKSNLKNREKIHLNVVELLTQARAEIFDQVLSLKEKTGTEIRKLKNFII
jgi:hypothetical protein